MPTLSVSQLVRKMKTALEFEVGEIWVEGEVSNLRKQASGHFYFSIKDEGAQIPCVLFKGRAKPKRDLIEEGRKVKLFGEITVYEAQGRAQVIVQKVDVAGEGELQIRFEQLKKQLDEEGLFSVDHKKPIPKFPEKIALITSPTGAALQDMLNVFARRAPWVEFVVYPVRVQGKGAEHGIAKAIYSLSTSADPRMLDVDLIIVGRGGGSIEDLWNFNEEVVARAIYECDIPIISAVGHEIDFTIADFVADERAPTPSAAAEIAVPDRAHLISILRGVESQLHRILSQGISARESELQFLTEALNLKAPARVIEQRELLLDEFRERLPKLYERAIGDKEALLAQLKSRLAMLSPERRIAELDVKLCEARARIVSASDAQIERKRSSLHHHRDVLRAIGPEATLQRGYSISLTEQGTVVRDVSDLNAGDRMKTILSGGEVFSIVDESDVSNECLSSEDT